MKRLFTLSFFILHLSLTTLLAQPYEWRGMMIDVSRHFMPIEYLYKEIDAMQMVGLNRLHLHLTDAAGWRMEIKSRPRLTDIGAWRTAANWQEWWDGDRKYSDSAHGFGGYYTQKELRRLVKYAKKKGIIIVPEIEFPAHSEEAVAAYPEIGFNHAEMDMKKEETYRFMEDVLREVADVFPSEYLHIGGDEASTQQDIQPEGMRRVRDIVRSLGRKMIVWDEALTDEPSDSDMVIMVWRNIETANKAMQLGHKVILCPGKYCYLNKAQDAPMYEPKAAGGYLPIDSVYLMPNPMANSQQPTANSQLLGVQGNIWTEYIGTPEYAEYMLWPRMYAIAEIGREGLTDKRDVNAFRERAKKITKQLQDKLHINAFDLSKERGERSVSPRPDALPFNVTYITKVNPYYPGSGERTLCDHRFGGWNNTDGRWQGFIGRNGMTLVLDLGKQTTTHGLSADFMQCTGPDIFFPYTLTIETSDDGNNFTQIFTKTYEDIYAICPEDYRQFIWSDSTTTRFIRLQALPGPRQGWIFCSEIEIY